MAIYKPNSGRLAVSSVVTAVAAIISAVPEAQRGSVMSAILNYWWLWILIALLSILWGFWYWVARILRKSIKPQLLPAVKVVEWLLKDSRLARSRSQEERALLSVLASLGGQRMAFEEEIRSLMQAASDDEIVIIGKCSVTGIEKRIPLSKFKTHTLAFRVSRIEGDETMHSVLCEPQFQNEVETPMFADRDECTDVKVDVVSLKAKYSKYRLVRSMHRMLDARSQESQE